jgi:hypothetical protein
VQAGGAQAAAPPAADQAQAPLSAAQLRQQQEQEAAEMAELRLEVSVRAAAARSRLQPSPGSERRREQQQLPPVIYDPAAAESYFQRSPLLVARRVAQVGAYITRFAGSLLKAQVDATIMGVQPAAGVRRRRRPSCRHCRWPWLLLPAAACVLLERCIL